MMLANENRDQKQGVDRVDRIRSQSETQGLSSVTNSRRSNSQISCGPADRAITGPSIPCCRPPLEAGTHLYTFKE